jgi:hypothetical protein
VSFQLKWRWIVAEERRAGEDGVHKTSTTAVDHGCLPGNEEVTAGLQTSLSPVNREMWKKALNWLRLESFVRNKRLLYAVCFQ